MAWLTSSPGTTQNNGKLHSGFSRPWWRLCPPCFCLLSLETASQSDASPVEERLSSQSRLLLHTLHTTAWAHLWLLHHHTASASESAAGRGFATDHGQASTASPPTLWEKESSCWLLCWCFWNWDQCPSDGAQADWEGSSVNSSWRLAFHIGRVVTHPGLLAQDTWSCVSTQD